MPLLHLAMLGGLVFVGVPVLLHLLMRQKPKHLLFPAFRFLQQRARTNRRKVRLRHLLLLLLRMALLALICLALAALRGRSQVGAVVLLIDTTPSMEYTVAGKTRLDDAKVRANELLNTVAGDSRVAVIETGDLTQQWGSVEEAREKINKLTIRPAGLPITSALAGAYRIFADQEDSSGDASGATQRHLYVITDRTTNCWDATRVEDLKAQVQRLSGPEVVSTLIDVGVEKPVNVAVTQIEVKPAVAPGGRDVVVKATVTATGQGCDTELICKLVSEKHVDPKPIKLPPGGTEVVDFVIKNQKLPIGFHQVEVSLATTDALPSDNARYATFEVRGARKILTITDHAEEPEDYARFWGLAFEAKQDFQCDVMESSQVGSPEQLKPYLAVCLLSVKSPDALWPTLQKYVSEGGHLLVIPGREETRAAEYSSEAAQKLLPITKMELPPTAKEPLKWEPLNKKHPLLAKFATWNEREDIGFLKHKRQVTRYWKVEPLAPANVIVAYDQEKNPALLERLPDSQHRGWGRVLMLTTPLDYRPIDKDNPNTQPWNDYASTTVQDGFFVVLANELIGYMVGDMDEPTFNFNSGQVVALPLPPGARFPEYTLDAPGITGADTRLVRGEEDSELAVRQTNFAGNARVFGPGNPPAWKAAFSLNPPGAEFQLDRVAVADIEKLFGEGSVVTPGQNRSLAEALGKAKGAPIDVFPWLMIAFVCLLVIESIVANRFYKPETPDSAAQPLASVAA